MRRTPKDWAQHRYGGVALRAGHAEVERHRLTLAGMQAEMDAMREALEYAEARLQRERLRLTFRTIAGGAA